MPYTITNHSKRAAAALKVTIKPSTRKNKKVDVYRDGKKVASIGHTQYGDYGTFLKTDKAHAKKRRKAYHARHAKTAKKVGSPSYYAAKILW